MENTFTTGLMSSGKSKILIEDFNIEKKENRRLYPLSVSIDKKTGYVDEIRSRNGSSMKSTVLNKDTYKDNLEFLLGLIGRGFKVFYIDEIQFMSKKTVEVLLNLSLNYKVQFRFYGLLTTFTGEYFESSRYLVETLDKKNIRFLNMECQFEGCRNIASNNARIVNDQIVRSGQTFIEKKSKYMSLCKNHYFS